MRRALWFLPALLLVLAAPAQSAPIVVSAGEVWTFNFDFGAAGVSPAPPYEYIQFDTGYDALTHGPGDFGIWKGFTELDGGGTEFFAHGSALISSLLPGDDGVFSMILSVVSGSFTVDPLMYGFESGVLVTDAVAPISATAVTPVPEPATLTLVGAGLAAAYRQRRRRASA